MLNQDLVREASSNTQAIALALSQSPSFVSSAAVAGGCGCSQPNGQCECKVFPPGGAPWEAVPVVVKNNWGATVEPAADCPAKGFMPPAVPYQSYERDRELMTTVVGEATIPAGTVTEVQVEPTQGYFSGYYVEIYATDSTNLQSRQRALIGRFNTGDCPGDCRTLRIFSDFYEANEACCNGRVLRTNFGKSALGEELRVEVENGNTAGSIRVQVVVRGYCHRGSCAC